MDPQLLTSHYGPRASIYAPLVGPGASNSQYPRAAASASQRASVNVGSSAPQVPLTGAMARLAAKQAELEGLRALREQSAGLAKNLEDLSERVDELVVGGEAVANVMASWQGVFRAILVAQSAISASRAEAVASANTAADLVATTSGSAEAGAEGTSAAVRTAEGAAAAGGVDPSLLGPSVPGTLVRIPVDLDAQQDGRGADGADASRT
ncbi:DASH complex subunit dad2 [Tilletia horrida]|nr:DASH complex subunit dad2 [Tilletia horrida]KAK0560016.1 DASH complex subunit dad2 [Tilletia horrida]